MFKKFFIDRYQKKISLIRPEVDISLNYEMPTPSAKEIIKIAPIIIKVRSFEQELKTKPDDFFKEKTKEYKQLIRDKIRKIDEKKEELEVVEATLDEILPFYFACVREAARRTLGMVHYDCQILGGVVLHKNKIAEMATGEGKTLVATLAASLNALVDRGVHVVTVNDYLAKRDWEWMSPIYKFLGLECGVIQNDMDRQDRIYAYSCDIVYGTNNEFGFDYLRDNMASSLEERVQRGHFYAIVDEVDSILIDEARTPLIISGPTEVSIDKYYQADKVSRQLNCKKVIASHDTKEGTIVIKHLDGSEETLEKNEFEDQFDAIVEEKTRNVYLTKKGAVKCEQVLNIKSVSEETPDKFSNYWNHYITNGLKAHFLFRRDKDYIVKDGKVLIVDEFTGRLMPGRRWSDGIHQAVEACEKLRIEQESQTLATVTLQNYFRMYSKLAGMTGTAYTEANEFKHIYKLDVVVIATNKPLARKSFADRVYKSYKAKCEAICDEIKELYDVKRPVLVGTSSIEDSETISFMLEKRGIPHNILNAKYHEREAHIVAQAGRLGQITIATNMAGRGTDIILGGNLDFFVKDMLVKKEISLFDENYQEEYKKLHSLYKQEFADEHSKVISLGGLHVIGAQRHESRRIDNQLKGRSGRQGDPGSSRFYVSFEDDLMRLFGQERIYLMLERFDWPEDQPFEHGLLTGSIEIAQKRVEAYNFEVRKDLLKYDDVMNQQRTVIYDQRKEILEEDDIKPLIFDMIDDIIDKHIPVYYEQENTYADLSSWIEKMFTLEISIEELENCPKEQLEDFIIDKVHEFYEEKEAANGESETRMMEKMVALSIIDSKWKEHLLVMDSLKEGIFLRGYAQVDPLVEYQKEAFYAFSEMFDLIKESTVELLFHMKVKTSLQAETVLSQAPKHFIHSQFSSLGKNRKRKEFQNNNTAKEIAANTSASESKPSQENIQLKGEKIGRNQPCPCGSGKKYKKCCGR